MVRELETCSVEKEGWKGREGGGRLVRDIETGA